MCHFFSVRSWECYNSFLSLSDRHFSAHGRGLGWLAGCPAMVFPWIWQLSPGSTTYSHWFCQRLWSTGQQREHWTTDTTTDFMAWSQDTGDPFPPGWLLRVSVPLHLMIPGPFLRFIDGYFFWFPVTLLQMSFFISGFVSLILLYILSSKALFIVFVNINYSNQAKSKQKIIHIRLKERNLQHHTLAPSGRPLKMQANTRSPVKSKP